MNLIEKNISQIAAETAEKLGFFVVDLIVRGTPNKRVIEIFIDGETNVSADDCAAVSREINSKIEEQSLITSSYRLDVSSPGIDRPLKFLKQFPKNINRKFEVAYKEGDQKKKITAKLTAVEDEYLLFEENNKNIYRINFNNITKAKVIISFS